MEKDRELKENQNSYPGLGFCSSEKVGFSCKFFEFDSGKETIYVHKNVTHAKQRKIWQHYTHKTKF